MKAKIAFVIAIPLLIIACSGGKGKFSLSGKFNGLDQGEFLCFTNSPAWGSLDTIRVSSGRFEIAHELNDTVVLTLQYPNFMQTQVIAIPGKSVSISGDANNLQDIKVSGGKDNELLNDFRRSIRGQGADAIKQEAEKFIRENPDSWAAVALFDLYFLQAEKTDYKKINSLLTTMLKACPQRRQLKAWQMQMGALLQCGVGAQLPSFKTRTLSGSTVSSSSLKGKPVLITFWSTMIPEFTYPITNQRRLMRSLSDKLNQLNICLDIDTTACMRVLRTDTIGGYNVCDCRSFDSPLVVRLGLKQLPANILVDAHGKILARDISSTDMEATLKRFNINE